MQDRKQDSGTTTQITAELTKRNPHQRVTKNDDDRQDLMRVMRAASRSELAKLVDEIMNQERVDFKDCVYDDLNKIREFFANQELSSQSDSAATPHKLRKKVSKRKSHTSRKFQPELKEVTSELIEASTSTSTSTPKSDSAIDEKPVTNGLRKSQSI